MAAYVSCNPLPTTKRWQRPFGVSFYFLYVFNLGEASTDCFGAAWSVPDAADLGRAVSSAPATRPRPSWFFVIFVLILVFFIARVEVND